MADLRTMMEQRAAAIREKIAKRKGKPGTADNIEVLETTLNEIERLLAQPEGDE